MDRLPPDVETKYAHLRRDLADRGSVLVALSGGVDSALLAKVCHDVLGNRAVAATLVSPMLAKSDLQDARAVAADIGMPHILVEADAIEPSVMRNPKDRCYHCKRAEFGAILRMAGMQGIPVVLDGSNADDIHDYRPGARAARELGVVSPLQAAGFTKDDVRALARFLKLAVWDKPANACLASRVPYGEAITPEILNRIEKAEAVLHALGFRGVRVRCHDRVARIEVHPEDRPKFCRVETMDHVSRQFKTFGFLYVCLDLDGYSTGSSNRVLVAP